MSQRILFLDVDGVLNSDAWYDGFLSAGHRIPRPPLDRAAVDRLDRIVRETGAWIVLSTSWRGYPEIPRWLMEHGCSGAVVGITPSFWPCDRGVEIAAWLNREAKRGLVVSRFCILDDGDDMGALLPYLVRTSQATGLIDEHVDSATAMLRGAR